MNKKLGIIIGVALAIIVVIAAVFLLKGDKEKEIPIVDIPGTDILDGGIDRDNLADRLDYRLAIQEGGSLMRKVVKLT